MDLYRQHGHGLFAYARSLTGRRDTAEDIVQETFLRALEAGAIPSAGYLYGIARNLVMESLRQADRRRRHQPELARTLGARAAFDDERALMSALLEELEDLPVEQREVVVLKAVGGLTFDEIGDLLQVPAATGASRYRYAIEKLTARLAASEETP